MLAGSEIDRKEVPLARTLGSHVTGMTSTYWWTHNRKFGGTRWIGRNHKWN